MPQDEKRPVQVTITAVENHADRDAVHEVVSALGDALDQPKIADTVDTTIVTEIKKGAGQPDLPGIPSSEPASLPG